MSQPAASQPASASSSASELPPGAGLPGLVMPPPSSSSHPLLSSGSLVPLRQLIAAFTSRSHDHLHDLVEALEQEPDEQRRRRQLFAFFHSAQLRLIRLHAMTSFLLRHGEELDRLGSLQSTLTARQWMYASSADVLKLLSRQVDAALAPAFDVSGAVHVLGRGDYRLLPAMLESVLNVEQRLQQPEIAAVKQRLDDQLRIRLLASQLPPALHGIEVKGGVARLTSAACVMTVSLRMMPRAGAAKGEEVESSAAEEEQRIKWRLFAVDWRLRVEGDETSALVSDAQTAQLISHCNALMHASSSPLLLLHSTLHAFANSLMLGILHQQAAAVQQQYEQHALTVTYLPSQSLRVAYWKEAQSIPHEGAAAAIASSASASLPSVLLISVEQHSIHVSHSPPLPELEGASPSASSAAALFAIRPQSISLSSLLARVLASHAQYRITQLQAFLQRQTGTDGRSRCYERMDVRPQGIDEDDSEEEDDADEEAEDFPHSAALRRYVLCIELVHGWTLHAKVEQQSGRFVFSWAGMLPSSAASSAPFASALSSLSQLQQLSALPSALQALRQEARIVHIQQSLSALHLSITVMRHPPIVWTGVPCPAPSPPPPFSVSSSSSSSPSLSPGAGALLYVRLSSSPLFFVLLSLHGSEAGADSLTMHMLHCELLDSPSPPPPLPASPQPAGQQQPAAAVRRKALLCDVLTPIQCSAIDAASLPPLSSLSSSALLPSASAVSALLSSPLLSFICRGLLYCEERVPLSLLLQQLQRQHLAVTVHSPTSLSFLLPTSVLSPTSPTYVEAQVSIQISASPAHSLSSSPTSLPSLYRAAASLSPTAGEEQTVPDTATLRCSWTASVDTAMLLRLYREGVRPLDAAGRPFLLSAGMRLLPSSTAASPSPSCLVFHYPSLSAASYAAFTADLSHLSLCCQLAWSAAMASSLLPLDKWKAMEAALPGDWPPPHFFSVISVSADALVLHYNLARLPYAAPDAADDICTLAVRYRHDSGELSREQHFLSTGPKRAYIMTLHTAPYAFPQHDFMEWELNHRLDIRALLRQVYWSCHAARVVHGFMRQCADWDRRAGLHHLSFHQQLAMPVPSEQRTAQSPPFTLVTAVPAIHTVSLIPESSTRLRFLFRRQHAGSKADVRLLNGLSFLQDFMAEEGRGGKGEQQQQQPQQRVHPPRRVPMAGLEPYLSSWYQCCGQWEQWKRVHRANLQQLTAPLLFDKTQLGSRPTDAALITVRMQEGKSGGLTPEEGDALCSFFSRCVCVPPYTAEPMQSFLVLCSSPLHVLQAMIPLLRMQLALAPPPPVPSSSSLRWFCHLSAPFDFQYDAVNDSIFLVLEVADGLQGAAVYLPVAFCFASGVLGWWELEEETAQAPQQQQQEDRQSAGARCTRKVKRPTAAAQTTDAAAVKQDGEDEVLLRDRWKSLQAVVEQLLAIGIDALITFAGSDRSLARTARGRLVQVDVCHCSRAGRSRAAAAAAAAQAAAAQAGAGAGWHGGRADVRRCLFALSFPHSLLRPVHRAVEAVQAQLMVHRLLHSPLQLDSARLQPVPAVPGPLPLDGAVCLAVHDQHRRLVARADALRVAGQQRHVAADADGSRQRAAALQSQRDVHGQRAALGRSRDDNAAAAYQPTLLLDQLLQLPCHAVDAELVLPHALAQLRLQQVVPGALLPLLQRGDGLPRGARQYELRVRQADGLEQAAQRLGCLAQRVQPDQRRAVLG